MIDLLVLIMVVGFLVLAAGLYAHNIGIKATFQAGLDEIKAELKKLKGG